MELLQRLDPRRRAIVPVALLVFLVNAASHVSAASIDLPQRPDEKTPEKPPTASVFGRPLWISGDVQARDRYKKNFDLDDATQDDTLELHHRLTLEALYSIAPHVVLYAKGRAIYEPTFTLDTGERTDSKELQRREHWLFVGDVLQSVLGPGHSLQIGRLKFSDERRWRSSTARSGSCSTSSTEPGWAGRRRCTTPATSTRLTRSSPRGPPTTWAASPSTRGGRGRRGRLRGLRSRSATRSGRVTPTRDAGSTRVFASRTCPTTGTASWASRYSASTARSSGPISPPSTSSRPPSPTRSSGRARSSS